MHFKAEDSKTPPTSSSSKFRGATALQNKVSFFVGHPVVKWVATQPSQTIVTELTDNYSAITNIITNYKAGNQFQFRTTQIISLLSL